ncbi:unnamed protein product [Heligmosomoides polygyrus]|uniref:Uncharacterized protein n=1 Tax=Heligmosomoides polygyrus TaxID=6339 RepID=A0A183GIG3_HELPZ|nr:unnamed protein product [Heligmosomoides polygyrus]
MIKRNKSFYLYLPVLSDPGTLDERILSRKKSAVNLFREYFARVMKMCSVPTPVAKIPHPLQHHNQQRQLQEQHQEVDSSPSSSSGEGVTAQSNNEGCWTLGPPICSDVKGPELYPILFEPPRRRIFGKLATNPFNKPANAQPPEPELSHVARWLDTIRLDDIEEYQEPLSPSNGYRVVPILCWKRRVEIGADREVV